MNPVSCKPGKTLIVGFGDIGMRISRRLLAQDIPMHGIARSAGSVQRMQELGVVPIRINLDKIIDIDLPVRDCVVFYLAPPPAKGHCDSRMKNFLASLNTTELPRRMVYLSTSGVYGDQRGRMIDEKTTPAPTADRAKRRYDAEQRLRQFSQQHGMDHIILRVGGIYGPGRLPVQRLEQGIPIIHEELAPRTNRIHADDLAVICIAAAERGRSGEIYNISDGTESNMTEYFNLVADHLSLPRPPTIGWDEAERSLSPGMLSYLRESRRMDNAKMIDELGITLMYPDLQSGLPHCHSETGATHSK